MDENLNSLFEDAAAPEESTAAVDDGQQEGTDTGEEKTEQKAEQTPEERARQAEGRRLREREQQGFNQGYQKARSDLSAVLKRLGIEDPDNGGTLDTVEQLEAYEKGLSDKRLASGRGTAEDIERVVEKAVRKATGQNTSKVDNREVDRQLAEIRAMDPEMTDLGAILNSDAGPKFRQYVSQGLNFTDAYTLAARDKLATLAARRAGYAERAKAAGKDHLGATQTRGQGAVSVPSSVLALYRELNPGMTDAEIQKHYNADVKKFGG